MNITLIKHLVGALSPLAPQHTGRVAARVRFICRRSKYESAILEYIKHAFDY